MSQLRKVVLAYSGGLDTSVAVRWIADQRLGWADPGIMELPPDGQIPG